MQTFNLFCFVIYEFELTIQFYRDWNGWYHIEPGPQANVRLSTPTNVWTKPLTWPSVILRCYDTRLRGPYQLMYFLLTRDSNVPWNVSQLCPSIYTLRWNRGKAIKVSLTWKYKRKLIIIYGYNHFEVKNKCLNAFFFIQIFTHKKIQWTLIKHDVLASVWFFN